MTLKHWRLVAFLRRMNKQWSGSIIDRLFPVCRYCHERIFYGAVNTSSYWGRFPYKSHVQCLKRGYEREAYLCQKIDCDCNDCRYFIRDTGRKVRGGSGAVWSGRCCLPTRPDSPHLFLKNWPVVEARPNFCSMMPCFVHRKEDG